MPIYEFTCQSCGLRFEVLFRKVTEEISHPCEACGEDASKQMSAVSFTFNHPSSQRNGPLPPSTGTSDDWNFDKAIGHDAEKKWGKIHENRAKKQEIIQKEAKQGRGITMDHIAKTREGGYRVITETERKRVNQNREAAFKVTEAAKKQTSDK